MRDLRQKRTFEVQTCSAEKVAAAAESIRSALDPAEREQVTALPNESLVRFDTAVGDGELAAMLAALVVRFGELRAENAYAGCDT